MQYAGETETGGIEEAPAGKPYVRMDGAWVEGVEAPPDTGGPWVQMGGVWVEHVFGCEYQLTPQVDTPLVLTAAFQAYVTQTTTSLGGGLYRLLPFVAVNGSSSNTEVEVRLTVQTNPGAVVVSQTITVDQTFTGAGDTLSFSGDVPVGLAPGVYDVITECRQPVSPGDATAVSGGTQLFRVQ